MEVPKKTTSNAVLGELGRYPLYIKVVTQMIKYWHRIVCMEYDSLLYKCLEELQLLTFSDNWLSCIKFIMHEINLDNIYNNPQSITTKYLSVTVKNNLKKRFESKWQNELHDDNRKKGSNKLRTYRTFKSIFCREPYLLKIKNLSLKKNLTKFRISAHPLEIEKGRYQNKPVDQRICSQCNLDQIEDEKHFLLHCTKFDAQRNLLFSEIIKSCKNFNNLDLDSRWIGMLSNEDTNILYCVSKFITDCILLRDT